jgi:hypothetical protein
LKVAAVLQLGSYLQQAEQMSVKVRGPATVAFLQKDLQRGIFCQLENNMVWTGLPSQERLSDSLNCPAKSLCFALSKKRTRGKMWRVRVTIHASTDCTATANVNIF